MGLKEGKKEKKKKKNPSRAQSISGRFQVPFRGLSAPSDDLPSGMDQSLTKTACGVSFHLRLRLSKRLDKNKATSFSRSIGTLTYLLVDRFNLLVECFRHSVQEACLPLVNELVEVGHF